MMELPDTLNNYLKPLILSQPVDNNQLPANLPRQLSSIASHYQNNCGNVLLLSGTSRSENYFTANLLAKEVKLNAYRVDLSALASSHPGETERNLLQVFAFAEKNCFVLLFDEADSLFSKRSDTLSNDKRFANLKIAYILKRIESYSGLIIFTTCAADDLDDALLSAIAWKIHLTVSI